MALVTIEEQKNIAVGWKCCKSNTWKKCDFESKSAGKSVVEMLEYRRKSVSIMLFFIQKNGILGSLPHRKEPLSDEKKYMACIN